MRKFCDYFLILSYLIYSIRQISRLQNYYISSDFANFFAEKVIPHLSTLHSTPYTAAPLPIKPTFHTKKENLHLPEVLITISSERSKKVLLAQMVYDGSSITSSDNIEVPRNLTSRTNRIAADSLQQGCMSRDTKSFAEMVYPIDILLSVITNLPLYLVFHNRVSYLVKIWHIHIR